MLLAIHLSEQALAAQQKITMDMGLKEQWGQPSRKLMALLDAPRASIHPQIPQIEAGGLEGFFADGGVVV